MAKIQIDFMVPNIYRSFTKSDDSKAGVVTVLRQSQSIHVESTCSGMVLAFHTKLHHLCKYHITVANTRMLCPLYVRSSDSDSSNYTSVHY